MIEATKDTTRDNPACDNPDAALLLACAEFEALEMQVIALSIGPNRVDDDDEADRLSEPLHAQQMDVLDVLDALPTLTAEGFRSRIRLLSLHNGHGHFSWDGEDHLAARLLRQVIRQSAP